MNPQLVAKMVRQLVLEKSDNQIATYINRIGNKKNYLESLKNEPHTDYYKNHAAMLHQDESWLRGAQFILKQLDKAVQEFTT